MIKVFFKFTLATIKGAIKEYFAPLTIGYYRGTVKTSQHREREIDEQR